MKAAETWPHQDASVLWGKCAVNSSGISPQYFCPLKCNYIVYFFFHGAEKTDIAKQLVPVTLALDEEYVFGRRQPPGEPDI